jgi:thiamine-phosphate pyrophosphorylase
MVPVEFRLYLITDRKLAPNGNVVAACAAALAAADAMGRRGAVAIQLREKDLDAGPLLALALEINSLCRRFGGQLLINDRVDVARAADAAGVHLPADSIGVKAARKLLGPTALLGVSTHAPEEVSAAAAAGADFAVFGPVFAPISKGAFAAPTGAAGLAAACRSAAIPVFALGGITPQRVLELAGSAARGVGVIGSVIGAQDAGAATAALLHALDNW